MKIRLLVTAGVVGLLLGCSSQQPATAKVEQVGGTTYDDPSLDDLKPGENPAAEARAQFYERGAQASHRTKMAQVDTGSARH